MPNYLSFINHYLRNTGGEPCAHLLLISTKFYSVFLFVCVLSLNVGAQKEYNNWYFGDYAGITFNNGNPVAIQNSAIYTSEGCASISDNLGYLLFYTDGVTVFNKLNDTMANGNGLLGSSTSTQSALIVKKPGCKNIFYIFTVMPWGLGGLYYSTIDMTRNSNLGEVIEKNIELVYPVTEKLTAIWHSNGIDVWVVAHEWNSNGYITFLVTNQGVNSNPVLSNSGLIFSNLQVNNAIGYLKPSPNGKLLADAVGGWCDYQISKFDRTSGILGNPIIIHEPNSDTTTNDVPYSVEFSPDSKFLYTKTSNSHSIYQYNINLYDSITIVDSKCKIADCSGYCRTMQLGPDNKIYMVRAMSSYLSSISSPNTFGPLCGYNDSALYLQNSFGTNGLPNNPFTAPYIQYEGCFDGAYSFHLTDTSSYIHWDFGVSGITQDTAQGNDPVFIYTQPGTYTVTASYLTDWNTYDTVVSTVWVTPRPKLFQKDTLMLCGVDQALIRADSIFDQYTWSSGTTGHQMLAITPGTYKVTASDCSCSLVDSVVVVAGPPAHLISDTTLCPGQSVTYNTAFPAASYLWSTGNTLPAETLSKPGEYWVAVTVDSCRVTDTCFIQINPISLSIGADTLICEGQTITLTGTGVFDVLHWWDGQTGTFRDITQSGIYLATALKEGCTTSDTLEIRSCSRLNFPNIITPNGDGKNDVFKPEYKEIKQYHLIIFDRWGTQVFESTVPTEAWDGHYQGKVCTPGTYFYVATYQGSDQDGRYPGKVSGVVEVVY